MTQEEIKMITMTKERLIQLCDKEGYEIPPSFLNQEIWTEKPLLRRKPGEELAELWIEAEEAKKQYYKAMDELLLAQKVWVAALECYNAKQICLQKEEEEWK